MTLEQDTEQTQPLPALRDGTRNPTCPGLEAKPVARAHPRTGGLCSHAQMGQSTRGEGLGSAPKEGFLGALAETLW